MTHLLLPNLHKTISCLSVFALNHSSPFSSPKVELKFLFSSVLGVRTNLFRKPSLNPQEGQKPPGPLLISTSFSDLQKFEARNYMSDLTLCPQVSTRWLELRNVFE